MFNNNFPHPITPTELQEIHYAIAIRYGINFSGYESGMLCRQFDRFMIRHHLKNTAEFWTKIITQNDFISTYINEMTVGFTEMFRNPEMWQKLKTDIISLWHHIQHIDVWIAGCSSGEEAYSLAILLEEERLLGKVNIKATDINKTSLNTAKLGIYPQSNIQTIIKNYASINPKRDILSFCHQNTNELKMHSQLSKNIKFEYHNLLNQSTMGYFDLILCRNVMIYFDDIFKMKVLHNFYNSLRADGKLIMGYYDILPTQMNNFFAPINSNMRIYKKI